VIGTSTQRKKMGMLQRNIERQKMKMELYRKIANDNNK
jgi:hypothetical protein